MNGSPRRTLLGMAAATACSASLPVRAQDYPSRDITLIVPFGPGASIDSISRQYAAQMKRLLQADIHVENKPGGSGTIGTNQLVRARSDGHTLGVGTNALLTHQPLTNPGLAWKAPDDYQPIVKLADLPVVLSVRADAPWKDFAAFMDEARRNPGRIRASVSGIGTSTDLAMQQLNKVADVRITTVPFTGGGSEAMTALLGGRVDATVGFGASSVGFVQAGRVRALAVFQKGRYDLFPDATPVVDAGYDASLPAMYCVIAPKGLPGNVLDRLASASLQAVRSEAFRKAGVAGGFVLDPKGPDGLRAELVEYTRIYADLLKFIEKR